MTTVDALVTWLRQQLDDDERIARAAGAELAPAGDGLRWNGWDDGIRTVSNIVFAVAPYSGYLGEPREHIARWDPARVLAEVEAKRRILDEYTSAEAAAHFPNWEGGNAEGLEIAVRLLAHPFADRPGFRDEWRLT